MPPVMEEDDELKEDSGKVALPSFGDELGSQAGRRPGNDGPITAGNNFGHVISRQNPKPYAEHWECFDSLIMYDDSCIEKHHVACSVCNSGTRWGQHTMNWKAER